MRYIPQVPAALSLSDSQLAQINAAAYLLRPEARDQFLRDVNRYLRPIRRAITPSDIATAINDVLGSTIAAVACCSKEIDHETLPQQA